MNHTLTQMPVLKQQVVHRKVAPSDRTKIKKYTDRYLSLVILLDLLWMNTSLFGFLLMQVPYEQGFGTAIYGALPSMLLLINILWLLVSTYMGVYRVFEGIKLDLKVKDLFLSTMIFLGLVSLIYYQFYFEVFQVHFLIQAISSFLILSSLSHYAIRYYNRNKTMFLSYAVVGGSGANIRYLDKVLSSVYGNLTYCVGRFATDELSGVNKLGTYEDIENYLNENSGINKLLYFYSDLPKSTVQNIIQLCRNRFIDFEVVPIGVDFFERGIQVEQLAHLPIFRRKREPLCELQNKILKRSFDILFSLAVILLVFPVLFPIVMLLIKLESRGPIFFLQRRTGYWNKPFYCIKFRTMTVNDGSDHQQAKKGDSRITWIGSILRKTNIDELPQFFNVLKGDMSIVGPRPHMIKHTEDYSELIDRYMIRHEVKPGITGWAQVNGWRGPTEKLYQMDKRVEFDVNYIENWNFWFDCKCIFLTVFNMIKGEDNAF
jgi:putative colanic acid biosysnthesis UDP-glucose lipid carrier transferase